MGDELLKKMGTDNLFMAFGERDIVLLECDDSSSLSFLCSSGSGSKDGGKKEQARKKRGDESPQSKGPQPKSFVVEIKGVDVCDPTTGEIRSHSTDGIAWPARQCHLSFN